MEDRDDWYEAMESNPKHWLEEVIGERTEESDEMDRLVWAARDSQEYMQDDLEKLNAELQEARAEAVAPTRAGNAPSTM